MAATGHDERPSPRSYRDLSLELRDLDPATDEFSVSLSGPAVGEPAAVRVKLAADELEAGMAELDDGGIEEEDDLIAFGRMLADRLLPSGDIRTKVTEVVRGLGVEDGVRLRLLIRDPELAQLPWEYTYLSILERESASDFLVLYPKVSMVRHEPLPIPQLALAPAEPPHLRMVAATANAPGYSELDLDTERRVLERALKDPPGDIATIDYEPVLTDPSAEALQAALTGKADIFHFAGHGDLDGAQGFLALPSADGALAERLPAEKLGKLLSGAGVRVALLGACESGKRSRASLWAGVATALVDEQVPCVVGMQYRVLDSLAIKFARAFYTGLASGLSVDEAVAGGRLAMYDPDDTSAAWGIPVLYLRSADGTLFPHLAEQPSATADGLRTAVRQVVGTIEATGKVVGIKLVKGAGGAGTYEVDQHADVVEGELTGIEITGP